MNPEFAYLLKVNVAFALFYAFYRLFFYKDTFFKLRRALLLSFFALALLYPLFSMQEWIRGQQPIVEVVYAYSAIFAPTVDGTEAASKAFDWKGFLSSALLLLYITGMVLLFLRFLIQLGSILWLAHTSRRITLDGKELYALRKPSGPFSFFRLIFLHPESHSPKEREEILEHEATHVSQWHSVDVMVCELIALFCWFNPFVWLLKREVRHNLEYLADNRVLQAGYDCKSYQYHLLGLAHNTQKGQALYNSFNILHLKNRILMMNRKRSHGIGRIKCVMFVPLMLLLMVVNNMELLARIVVLPTPPPPMELPITTHDAVEEVDEEWQNQVFTVVEQMPKFPGGEQALMQYIARSIKYPEEAQRSGVQGRVISSFVVDEQGQIKDITVVRGVHASLDEEAVRVIAQSPKWEPGRQRGKSVQVRYTLPILFRLQETDNEGRLMNIEAPPPNTRGAVIQINSSAT